MIFNKSFKKGKKVKLKDDSTGEKPGKDRLLSLWIREIRGVYLWICMAFASRVLIRLLCDLASFRTTNTMPEYFWRYTGSDDIEEFTGAKQEMLKIGSVLAGWTLTFMPSKVITLQSPGFIFANPILLLWIRDKTQMIPNIPTRASDYVLGRIKLSEFFSIVPIHFIITFLMSTFLWRVLTNDMISIALGPVEYADGKNPWIVDFFSEVIITAAFTVALQVLPVLFQLNHLPRWCVVWLFFPIFNFSVDLDGMGSAFCPNILFTFGSLGYGASGMRIMSSMLGGMIGGKIMQLYFPDDHPVDYR